MKSINGVTHGFGQGDRVENRKEIVNLKNRKKVEWDAYFMDVDKYLLSTHGMPGTRLALVASRCIKHSACCQGVLYKKGIAAEVKI